MSKYMMGSRRHASTTHELLSSDGVPKILFRLLRKVQMSHCSCMPACMQRRFTGLQTAQQLAYSTFRSGVLVHSARPTLLTAAATGSTPTDASSSFLVYCSGYPCLRSAGKVGEVYWCRPAQDTFGPRTSIRLAGAARVSWSSHHCLTGLHQ